MFRLISINLNDWNYLGHIPANKLIFVPGEEMQTSNLPYTTVLIGQNGTGKSTLLSYIAKIFEDLKFYKENEKRAPTALNFPYSIIYQIGKKKIQITHKDFGLDLVASKGDKRKFRWIYHITVNGKKDTAWEDIDLPEQVIAVSYLPMDRFRQKRNLPDDFYQYLGLRHRSNAASPQYFLNNTLPLLFKYISENKSVSFLKSILKFMSMDVSYLGISLEYRYKRYFFRGDLDDKKFVDLFENHKLFSKRKVTPFSVDYYNRYIKNNKELIASIVRYLNTRAFRDNITVGQKSLLEFNLFDNIELIEELSLIHHLQKLDLLTSASLLFRKNRDQFIDTSKLSSGEFHFLTTMIAIQSTLKKNSLILIDEPDTSLHPNWQMKYIHNLKELFKKWNSVHFIMATHSHFIISDLENRSSEIIGLTGSVPFVEAKSFNTETYGYSAEEVLLEIFNVPTTRNHFIYEKVSEILEMVAMRDSQKETVSMTQYRDDISAKIKYLRNKGIDNLSKEDPLKEIIDKLIKKYGGSK